MASDRVLRPEEKAEMQKLSLAILDLCATSGLRDCHLIANAAIIGCAGVVASTIPDNAPRSGLEVIAQRAGDALNKEIVTGYERFARDLAANSTPN